MPASIFAFDGVLAATIPLRAQSLVMAGEAEGRRIEVVDAVAALPGRTLLEAASQLLDGSAHDPTLAELVGLRAQRSYRALVAHGVSFDQQALAEVHRTAERGDRVVVRADSDRRDVEPLLALAGLEHVVHLVRASDDPPRGSVPSLERSWQAIDHRLSSMSVDVRQRTAWETTEGTARAALAFALQVHVRP